QFFTKLTELLSVATSAHKSSIFLTQKPLNPLLAPDAAPSSLLVRATDGETDSSKRLKIATVVDPKDLEAFFARYADVCKANMGSLKKRDRKKKKAKKR
ncbi:signal recognition particle, SRP14 subunit, partial [Trichophaea hybrida]